jgi:hypothetical protein
MKKAIKYGLILYLGIQVSYLLNCNNTPVDSDYEIKLPEIESPKRDTVRYQTPDTTPFTETINVEF